MTSPAPVAGSSLRGVLGGLVAALGVLHVLVAVGRSHDWTPEGAGLAAAGVTHLVAAVGVVLGRGRRVLVALSIWLVVAAAALVITRTVGYPFGPFADYVPSISSYDVAILVISLVAVSLVAGVLLVDADVLGRPGWRFDTLAPLAVVVAAVPGLAVSSWVDDASSLAGSGHVHNGSVSSDVSSSTLTFQQRDELARQIVLARDVAVSVPTLADALAAGWIVAGDVAPGGGLMVVDPTIDHRELLFDPARPMGLLYASSDESAPVVGLQFAAWSDGIEPPPAFVGQDSMWHLHTGTCVVDGPSGDYAIPLDESVTGVGCDAVGGSRTDTVSFMMRAWLVPGWENPNGTFAHDHPALP